MGGGGASYVLPEHGAVRRPGLQVLARPPELVKLLRYSLLPALLGLREDTASKTHRIVSSSLVSAGVRQRRVYTITLERVDQLMEEPAETTAEWAQKGRTASRPGLAAASNARGCSNVFRARPRIRTRCEPRTARGPVAVGNSYARTNRRLPFESFLAPPSFLTCPLRFTAPDSSSRAAWAAARRATGTRKGEQLT